MGRTIHRRKKVTRVSQSHSSWFHGARSNGSTLRCFTRQHEFGTGRRFRFVFQWNANGGKNRTHRPSDRERAREEHKNGRTFSQQPSRVDATTQQGRVKPLIRAAVATVHESTDWVVVSREMWGHQVWAIFGYTHFLWHCFFEHNLRIGNRDTI